MFVCSTIDNSNQAPEKILADVLLVIRACDRRGHPEICCRLAAAALALGDILSPGDRVTLYCNVFKYSLVIKDYDQAYNVIMSLPASRVSDSSQTPSIPSFRQECLHKLVILLCEDRKVDALCLYPWTGLRKDVENVIWWKAQNTDLSVINPSHCGKEGVEGGIEGQSSTTPNYYLVLHAFLLESHNYLQAASYMYLYALRLEREMGLADAHLLRKQGEAFLAVINALSMVEQPWIVHNDVDTEAENDPAANLRSPFTSAKRRKFSLSSSSKSRPRAFRLSGEDARLHTDSMVVFNESIGAMGMEDDASMSTAITTTLVGESDKKEVLVVVDLQHVRRRYMLCVARLELSVLPPYASNIPNNASSRSPIGLSARETVSLLLKEGMLDLAMTIALEFFPGELEIIFDALTEKCVALQLHGEEGEDLVPLIFESVPVECASGYPTHARACAVGGSIPNRARSKSEQAWALLASYLQRYDGEKSNYRYRVRVADLILRGNEYLPLPRWLVDLFKGRRGAEKASLGFARSGCNLLPLLRLMMRYKLVEDAVCLLIEVMESLRREHANDARPQEVKYWLPWTLIEEMEATLQAVLALPLPHEGMFLTSSSNIHNRHAFRSCFTC